MDIQALLKEMTLDEKVDQLLQLATFFYEGSYIDGEITGPMEDLGINQQTIHNSGKFVLKTSLERCSFCLLLSLVDL